MMARVADSTGTPLDDRSLAVTAELRDGLGLNDLVSKRVTSS